MATKKKTHNLSPIPAVTHRIVPVFTGPFAVCEPLCRPCGKTVFVEAPAETAKLLESQSGRCFLCGHAPKSGIIAVTVHRFTPKIV
jgi:hypothetical protein